MSVGTLGEGLLTQSQVALLDELTSAIGTADGSCGGAEKDAGVDHEGFYQHWRHVKAHHRLLEEKERRSRWSWVDQVQEVCDASCDVLSGLLAHLESLDSQRKDVERKTTALHEQCVQMVQDQEQLSSTAEALAERLDFFDRVADVARVLDQGALAVSSTDSQEDLAFVLDQLDGSIEFLEAHTDFCQAQAYLNQFEHLRNRACISVRSALQKSLERSIVVVEQQVKEKMGDDSADMKVFYARFLSEGAKYKPLTALLQRRVDVHETYSAELEQLEAFYVHLRVRLVTAPVIAHLQSIMPKDLEISQLASATRQAAGYTLEVSCKERDCFEAYFEIRQPQEALRTLLEAVADIFYRALRPMILHCDDIDPLREITDCLQLDILEPQQESGKADMMPVLSVVFRLLKDVQEKLIFQVEMYIRMEIQGYEVVTSDLDYPAILCTADPADVGTTEDDGDAQAPSSFQHGWFPTMERTLAILAKIYRRLELSTFQGLAQEAVDICINSLKHASGLLAQRPERSHAMAPLVLMMDSQLFLIKHLLILREQVAGFECDLVVSEKYFNFSNVWEALNLKLPDGLLGILKPKMQQSQVDSKKDIEAELKAACETLITHLTAHITQPLAAFNQQIMDFLAGPGRNNRASLKEQAFMSQEKLRGIVHDFLSNVRERIPFAVAHIRLYLTHAGASRSDKRGDISHNTISILFKPVQIRLVDTWGRLEGLLEEQEMTSAEIDALGFLRPDALRDLVSSLFSQVMEMPWQQLVETISQVPRAAAPVYGAAQAALQPVPAERAPPAVPSAAAAAQAAPAAASQSPAVPAAVAAPAAAASAPG
ncbi:unnamed protein product, partial [Prorocentrum cordatum]